MLDTVSLCRAKYTELQSPRKCRYLLKDGVRYGHILDPRTGWPVSHSPRSITVAASSCTEAGLLATLALLHGARAGEFLEEQEVRYWLLQ
jgi:FAD:protein FMN transferase